MDVDAAPKTGLAITSPNGKSKAPVTEQFNAKQNFEILRSLLLPVRVYKKFA